MMFFGIGPTDDLFALKCGREMNSSYSYMKARIHGIQIKCSVETGNILTI